MKIYFLLISLLVVAGCEEDVTGKQTMPEKPPGIWFDHGVQCSQEIVKATTDLNSLPFDAVAEMVQYVNLENGAPRYSQAVQGEDLKYVGKFTACGKPIRLWQYPCNNSDGCYVGIQPFKDSYYIGQIYPEGLLKQ
jgi:hypothetical protein